MATPPPEADAAPVTTTGTVPQGSLARILDYLKEHPEDEVLFARAARHNVARTYPLLDTLNLPREQLSRLKDLLGSRMMDQLDTQVAAMAQGLERGSPAWSEAMQRGSAETSAGIREILGDNAGGLLAQLQVRLTLQNQVQYNFAPDFADAGAPISPDQSAALVQAFADANYVGKDMAKRPANYNEADPVTGLTPHDLRILDDAARFLQPVQIERLKSNLVDVHKVQAITGRTNSIVPVPLR